VANVFNAEPIGLRQVHDQRQTLRYILLQVFWCEKQGAKLDLAQFSSQPFLKSGWELNK
jgi:hypothetical protein